MGRCGVLSLVDQDVTHTAVQLVEDPVAGRPLGEQVGRADQEVVVVDGDQVSLQAFVTSPFLFRETRNGGTEAERADRLQRFNVLLHRAAFGLQKPDRVRAAEGRPWKALAGRSFLGNEHITPAAPAVDSGGVVVRRVDPRLEGIRCFDQRGLRVGFAGENVECLPRRTPGVAGFRPKPCTADDTCFGVGWIDVQPGGDPRHVRVDAAASIHDFVKGFAPRGEVVEDLTDLSFRKRAGDSPKGFRQRAALLAGRLEHAGAGFRAKRSCLDFIESPEMRREPRLQRETRQQGLTEGVDGLDPDAPRALEHLDE